MQFLPLFSAILIFFLLAPSSHQQESNDIPENWVGNVVQWPSIKLRGDAEKYTAAELSGWYCATSETVLFDKELIQIGKDGTITIETMKYSGKLLMLYFLVDKRMKEFRDIRIIPKGDGISQACFLDDVTFDRNEKFLSNVPFCKKATEQKGNPNALQFRFVCKQGQSEFWQPKAIEGNIAASKTKGIMALGQVLPFPIAASCKNKIKSAKLLLGWGEKIEYQLLVHKNDVKSGMKTLRDCLRNEKFVEPPPTTTKAPTTTVTTKPTTTRTTPTTKSTTTRTTPTTKPTTTRTTPTTKPTTTRTTPTTKPTTTRTTPTTKPTTTRTTTPTTTRTTTRTTTPTTTPPTTSTTTPTTTPTTTSTTTPTTTPTMTPTTTPTTTSTTTPTTTVRTTTLSTKNPGARTRWTLGPDPIYGFLDQITPFPPGYTVNMTSDGIIVAG